jgi:hypothetical protein
MMIHSQSPYNKQSQQKPQIQQQQLIRYRKNQILTFGIIFIVLLVLLIINLGITYEIIKKNKSTSTLSSEELSVIKSDYYYGMFGCALYIVGIVTCLYFYYRDPRHEDALRWIYWIIGLTVFLNIVVPTCITAYNWSKVSYNTIFTKSSTLVGSGLAWYAYMYNGFMCFIVAAILTIIVLGFVILVCGKNPGACLFMSFIR